MTQAITSTLPALVLPALVASADERGQRRFLEFFAVTIRNAHTRRAYARAAGEFLGWCDARGVTSIAGVQPLHVAAWIEQLGRDVSVPTVAIDVTTPAGLRDRALIGLMVYSFARIGAALGMRVEDVFVQNRRLWVRLHEKGGKRHEMPCHHNLEEYLTAYLDGCALRDDRKGPLFRTIARGTKRLSDTPLPQANAFQMVRRRAVAADIETAIGNHSFRATGITAYLKNGGTLERAARMANHASTRTTQLYDRRSDDVTLDEVERVLI